MRLIVLGLVVLGLATSAFLTSCFTGGCTLIGCPSQVQVVGTSSTPFEAGRYRATVFAKDRELSHEVVFSGDPNTAGSGQICGETFCLGLVAGAEGVGVNVSSFSDFDLIDSVRIEFEFDGKLLGSTKVVPVYEDEYPNGEHCNVCPTFSTTLSLDSFPRLVPSTSSLD